MKKASSIKNIETNTTSQPSKNPSYLLVIITRVGNFMTVDLIQYTTGFFHMDTSQH